MAGPLALDSWPGPSGFTTASYFTRYLEQMQYGMPSAPGVLQQRDGDILGTYANELKVSANSSGMVVQVAGGRITAKGIFAKIPDASLSGGVYALTVSTAHATLQRVDSVVVTFNLSTGGATLEMLNGTPATAGTAVPAALTQGAASWQECLALVMVDAAATTIATGDVIDERRYSNPGDALARALSMSNPIINGGMDVWNDGTSFAAATTGRYGPEMWRYGKNGAGVHTMAQAADVPAIAEGVQKDNFSLHLDVTTADVSIAAADIINIQQLIEGSRAKRVLQRGFVLPFWVKASVVGPHAVCVSNSGTDRSVVLQYFIRAADTWELHWVHVPPSPTAGTWNYTNGIGARISWTQYTGSDGYATTPGEWETGNKFGTARTVNELSSIANNFKLWGVGPANTEGIILPFSPHPDEEALCRRYYELFGSYSTNQQFANGHNDTTASGAFGLEYTPKRTAPTISFSDVTHFRIQHRVSATNVTGITPAGGQEKARLNVTVAAGLTQGDGSRLEGNTVSAFIAVSARLA